MILDTSAVIDLLKGNEEIRNILYKTPLHSIATTSVTVFEIYQGIKGNEKGNIDEFFQNIRVFDLDKAAAMQAGIMQLNLKGSGQIIEPEDCMIGGIALVQDIPLVTRNKKHFERIKQLRIITY